MIKITIFEKNDLIVGFQVKGHSGYAVEGQDIVCAGVSVASQMTLVGLQEVLGKNVETNTNDGFLVVRLNVEDVKDKSVQVLFESLIKTLEDITKNYSKYVKMEVKKDVY